MQMMKRGTGGYVMCLALAYGSLLSMVDYYEKLGAILSLSLTKDFIIFNILFCNLCLE